MFLWLFLITARVCWGFLTSRSTARFRRQILLVRMWLGGGGRKGVGRKWQNPVMIWLFCAAEHRGEGERESGTGFGCCYVFESGVFLLVARTIMGPHGINRAVQRLEFSDCKKGLGEHLPPDLSDLWITVYVLWAKDSRVTKVSTDR